MGPLTALALATPIFGFSLAPPDVAALAQAFPGAQVQTAVSVEASADSGAAAGPSAAPTDQANYVVQLRKRAKIAKVHRTMGIATWAAMAFAVAAGTVQYRNLYGAPFTGELADTPCVKGNSWPNQNQCSGPPLPHAIPGFVAGGLYFTTMGLAWAMPDPDNAAKGDSKFAKTIRTHKALRWVHLASMVSQIVTGVVIANPRIGLDRSEDFDTLKKLGGFHLFSGYIGLAALSWAGTIMLL